MKHSEPLFISSAEMDRHCKAAKELRSQYLRDIAEGLRRKIMPQKQSVVFVEAFVVVTLLVICVYWATFIRVIGSDGSWLRLRDEPGATDHQHVSSSTNFRGRLPQTHRRARHIGLASKLVREAEGRHA